MLFQLLCLLFWQASFGELVKPVYVKNDDQALSRLFEKYLQKYNKVYDETEKAMRFKIFLEKLEIIMEYNELNENIALSDINPFTDWTEEELGSLLGLKLPTEPTDTACQTLGDPTPVSPIPMTWDWRDQGVVSTVKNQGQCGSCWAFSTTGLLESRYLQNRLPVDLSEQQLVDCSTEHGCNGSFPSTALTYIMQSGGIETEDGYPYHAAVGSCQFDRTRVAARVVSCSQYTLTSEDALMQLLYQEGPLSICVAAQYWSAYHKGIWRHCEDQQIDHAVLLVGFGTENNEDYWIIKNSWGPEWGENGYIRIKKGVNCNAIAGIGQNQALAASAKVA